MVDLVDAGFKSVFSLDEYRAMAVIRRYRKDKEQEFFYKFFAGK